MDSRFWLWVSSLDYVIWVFFVTMRIEHIISVYSLEPIMVDPKMWDLLVLKALRSLNMWNHMIRVTMPYDQEIFWCIAQTMHSPVTIWKLSAISGIVLLHINIFWPRLILFICSTQMSIIISFLPNGDSKYSYVFPLMTNVILIISHKGHYWAYSNYEDLFLRWTIIQ
jgi:hypothetical protein